MIFSSIPFSVDLKALLKDAHIDAEDEELVSTVQRIATNAEAVAAPKAVISPAPLLQKNGRISQIGDHAVCGELFDRELIGKMVYAYLCSCGAELASLSSADPLEDFLFDLIRLQALRAAVDHLNHHCGISSPHVLNPGDHDEWPMEAQRIVFDLLGTEAQEVGAMLTEHMLIVPYQSLSGLIYPGEARTAKCARCSNGYCPARHAPYNRELAEREGEISCRQ